MAAILVSRILIYFAAAQTSSPSEETVKPEDVQITLSGDTEETKSPITSAQPKDQVPELVPADAYLSV